MSDKRISPEMIRLYDQFTHQTIDRRGLMTMLVHLAGSTAAATALLSLIEANPAAAGQVDTGDARIAAKRIQWPVMEGHVMKGYFAVPRPMPQPLPAIMVLHENRGLNGYIEDVTRRIALAGFVAIAPDFLTPLGGSPQDPDQARQMITKLDPRQTVANALATIDWLRKNPRVTNRIGALGFCWGGGLVNRIAIAGGRKLDAGVVFYGPSPAPAEATAVKARMLFHFAGLDERVNATGPAWTDALKRAGVRTDVFNYPNVNHAFHNETSIGRYDSTAAELAWERSITFLKSLQPVVVEQSGAY